MNDVLDNKIEKQEEVIEEENIIIGICSDPSH